MFGAKPARPWSTDSAREVLRPLAHEAAAVGEQTALHLRRCIGLPDVRKILAAQEWSQHFGIDLIRLYLRLRDRLRLEWIPHHELPDLRTYDVHDRPSIGRGIQSHTIRLPQFLCRKPYQFITMTIDSTTEQNLPPAVDHAHLQEVPANV